MKRREAVIGHEEDVRERHTVTVHADRVDDPLHSLVCRLIGELDVFLIAGNLCRILTAENGIWIQRVRSLTRVGQQILMFETVRLFDVNHDQIGVGNLTHCAQRNPGLIVHEMVVLIFVDRFKFQVREAGQTGIQAFRETKVVLVSPEADIVVDVIYIRQNRGVRRDVISRVASDVHGRKVGRQGADEKCRASFLRSAFKIERLRRTVAELYIGGTGRR